MVIAFSTDALLIGARWRSLAVAPYDCASCPRCEGAPQQRWRMPATLLLTLAPNDACLAGCLARRSRHLCPRGRRGGRRLAHVLGEP